MSNGASAKARTGPPVLFLTGVGMTAAAGVRAREELEARFRILEPRLDRDAAAKDDVPSAEAALAALDRAGVEEAHVVGLSFGASIALQIAARHPHRVRSLVVGSSTAGGELYAAPEPAVREFIHRLDELPAEEGLWASIPYLYAASTRRQNAPLIGEDIARRLRRPPDPRDYRRQLDAARTHDVAARLTDIAAPTLVVHGEEDRILPLANGRRLADGIAQARFISLAGAAHAFPTDVPSASREVLSFLLAHSPRRRGSTARRTVRAARA
jgi:pimeloyl-ACP methyl ester carboxylesterase